MLKFACVMSHFNEEISTGLLAGAREFLKAKDIDLHDSDIFSAPGAFEIPLIAQQLAKTRRYQGVICLGCVIKGDTAHFELISLGATIGIMQCMLNHETPISFGVLTTYNDEQAVARSKPDAHNKGREAASACLEAAQTLARIKTIERNTH